MVNVGTGTTGTRFVRTEYPNTDGLEAGTTKTHGRKTHLEPEIDLLNDEVGF
jgi:hypothetical protein